MLSNPFGADSQNGLAPEDEGTLVDGFMVPAGAWAKAQGMGRGRWAWAQDSLGTHQRITWGRRAAWKRWGHPAGWVYGAARGVGTMGGGQEMAPALEQRPDPWGLAHRIQCAPLPTHTPLPAHCAPPIPPARTADALHAMFPDDDAHLNASWDAYGEAIDPAAFAMGGGGVGGGAGGAGAMDVDEGEGEEEEAAEELPTKVCAFESQMRGCSESAENRGPVGVGRAASAHALHTRPCPRTHTPTARAHFITQVVSEIVPLHLGARVLRFAFDGLTDFGSFANIVARIAPRELLLVATGAAAAKAASHRLLAPACLGKYETALHVAAALQPLQLALSPSRRVLLSGALLAAAQLRPVAAADDERYQVGFRLLGVCLKGCGLGEG